MSKKTNHPDIIRQLPRYQCLRCPHSWVPRKRAYPRICPKCKSAYWDTPRQSEAKR